MTVLIQRLRSLSAAAFVSHQRFAEARSTDGIVALWSFAEAVCWFILPDFFLLPLALLAPKHAWRRFLIAIPASILGGAVLWSICQFAPETAEAVLFRIPFTTPAMLHKLASLSETWNGLPSAVLQPYSAVPYKVWTFAAVTRFEWPCFPFLLLTGASRAVRMLLVTASGVWLAKTFERTLREFWLVWLGLGTLGILAFLTLTS